MRKLLLNVCVLVVVALASFSCGKDEIVEPGALPTEGTAFLRAHFENVRVLSVEREKEGLFGVEYEVKLENRVDVKFDKDGRWISVDADDDRPLPSTGFILSPIRDYVADNYSNSVISGIERERNGFDVELTNGLDLKFDTDGKFVRIDP